MTNKQFAPIRGRAMRATRTNECGNPVLGPKSVVPSEGFISVTLTANTETGEAISVTNANGKVMVQDTPPTRFVNYGVEIAFIGVNPDLFTMLTNQPLVLDAQGNSVGFRQNSKIPVDGHGFALEVWTGIASQVCVDNEPSYGYTLLPFIKGGVLGDFTIENGAMNFTLTGGTTRDGSGWGVGPFDVTRDESGEPGPLLEAIDTSDHIHIELVTVPPPAVVDGNPVALGVPATGATQNAGTSATLTPANSYPPADLADAATGFTATPNTAWTTGSYVTLQDGTEAHWSGTAWVAGRA